LSNHLDVEVLESTTFAGKRFTRKQLSRIQVTVAEIQNLRNRELGHTICEHHGWLTPNRNNKIQSCLKALEQMEKIGLFTLPKKVATKKRPQKDIQWTEKTDKQPGVCCDLDNLMPVQIRKVIRKKEILLWNEYVDRYHYLKYRRPIGSHSRYFIVSGDSNETVLGCLLFSATPVYALTSRDQWIGWTEKDRSKHLNLILNNSRFLIFPWIDVPNLSSKVLSITSKQIANDWEMDHGYRPVLLETFVDPTKYKGTSYQAANWSCIGQTSGSQWNDKLKDQKVSKKDM